jgi:HSP20 family molecular chaperone IbpA
MTSVVHRPALLPDLFGWLESGWPFAGNPIRVEEYVDDDRYVVRAELPGFDPDEDIHVAVQDGHLVLSAHRAQEEHGRGHSEFRYGRFARTLPLPAGVRATDITATYRDGILEVAMPAVGVATAESVPIAIGQGT